MGKNEDAFSTLRQNLIINRKHFQWPDWLPQTNLDINELLMNYEEELMKLRGQVQLLVGGPPCQGFSMAGKKELAMMLEIDYIILILNL